MSEVAVNSAQVWTKLQKRLGNNTSYWISDAERALLVAVIDAGGAIAEQAGFDPIGASAEIILDFAGPYEWSVSSDYDIIITTPALTLNVPISTGDQTPDVCNNVASALENSSIGDLINVQVRSGLNVTASEIVLTLKDGGDITVSSTTLT